MIKSIYNIINYIFFFHFNFVLQFHLGNISYSKFFRKLRVRYLQEYYDFESLFIFIYLFYQYSLLQNGNNLMKLIFKY